MAGLTHKLTVPIPPPPTLPAAGGTWTDPTFGTAIMRLTDANDGSLCTHGYAYWRCMSADNRYIALSCGNVSKLITIDPDTFTRVSIENLPAISGWTAPPTQEIMWSSVNVNRMWCKNAPAGRMYYFDVSTRTYTLVKEFTGDYLGQWFMSEDDDVFSFLTHSQVSPYPMTGLKVWKRSTDTVIYSETFGHGVWEEAHIDKTGRYLIKKSSDNTVCTVVDLNGPTETTISSTTGTNNKPGHSDNGYGILSGIHSVGDGHASKRDLSNPTVITRLTTTAWWDVVASHVSMRHNDDSTCLISTNYSMPQDKNHPFANECYFLATDGSKTVRRVCHHYYADDPYWGISRAVSSADGRYVIFASKWGQVNGRIDTFLVDTYPELITNPDPDEDEEEFDDLMALDPRDVKTRGILGIKNSYAVIFDTEFTNGVCRAIISSVAGTIGVTYENGETDTVPIQAGFNPLCIKKISTSGTSGVTAADVRAGY
jgi:hypothetical protein